MDFVAVVIEAFWTFLSSSIPFIVGYLIILLVFSLIRSLLFHER